jgi:hypothetical protein
MSSTFTCITFYVAPTKEHHPLVSKLLRCEHDGRSYKRDGDNRMVKVTREGEFLTGRFTICDYYMGEEGGDEFFDLYWQVCALGYISQDHETQSWDYSDGDDEEHELREQERKKKEKLKFFWLAFPNLMFIIKHERPPIPEELANELNCPSLSEDEIWNLDQNYPGSLSANLVHAEYK